MALTINVWTYAFTPPGPAFSDTDSTKYNWSEISVSPVNLINYPVNHEVLGAIVYFTGPFANTSNINVNYKAYRNNIKFFEMTQVVPPSGSGYQWDWYQCKFWSGRASWEIYGPCTVKIEITLSGWTSGSATLYMNVVAPIEETIGWQANVFSGSHNFYLISLYGTNTNNTIGGFQASNMNYQIVNTSSMSRYDYITTSNVSKNDCLTIVAENYNSSTGQISGIYDAWIQNAVV